MLSKTSSLILGGVTKDQQGELEDHPRNSAAWSVAHLRNGRAGVPVSSANSGCGVLMGAERKTTRRAWLVMRSRAAGKAADGAVHRRNTLSTPERHLSRVSGTVRSPPTVSTCSDNATVPGVRLIARTCAPVDAS